jgi:hypothetical protein
MAADDRRDDEPDTPERPWVKPAELAAREGIDRTTVWAWADKGIVEVRRRGPRTGVRMRMRDE